MIPSVATNASPRPPDFHWSSDSAALRQVQAAAGPMLVTLARGNGALIFPSHVMMRNFFSLSLPEEETDGTTNESA